MLFRSNHHDREDHAGGQHADADGRPGEQGTHEGKAAEGVDQDRLDVGLEQGSEDEQAPHAVDDRRDGGEELDGARRYLIGTFPLRFGSAPPVAAAASGLTAIGLDLSELDRYRDAIAAVDRDAVVRIAEELEKESERIVIVGDAEAVRPSLEAEGFLVEVHA